MTILGFLPIVTLFLLLLANPDRTRGLGERFLDALLVWGTLIVFFTEGLSLFDLLSQAWITTLWLLLVLILLFVLIPSRRDVKDELSRTIASVFLDQKPLVVGILAIVGTTLLIALISPPNTWDSMTYHMSRVVNWVQNGSVRHYPTNIDRQLYLAPFAEFAILQFQLLTGSDRFANLVQWVSMIGSLTAVCLIARTLGANRVGQVFSVVFAATIPMGILQSTSTQTDYVVTLWFVSFVYFLIIDLKSSHPLNLVRLGVALGLAILTKATAYIYAFPFLAWYVIAKSKGELGKATKIIAIIGSIIILLNTGHYYRNITWFGSPLGPSGEVETYANERFGVDVTLSNVIRNVTFHLGTRPIRLGLNTMLEDIVADLHLLIGTDVNDASRTTGSPYRVRPLSTHEDLAGSPLHLILGVITLLLVFLHGRFRGERMLTVYVCMIVIGFLFFCSYLKWDPWRQRLHLPLFVVIGPAVGIISGMLLSKRSLSGLAYGLLIASLPWLISNNSKPLLPVVPFSSKPSIVATERLSQYFANRSDLEGQYREVTLVLKKMACRTIGVVSGGDDWEYPLWVLLHDTGDDFTILHSDVESTNGQYQVWQDPCARVYIGYGKEKSLKSNEAAGIYEWDYVTIVRKAN